MKTISQFFIVFALSLVSLQSASAKLTDSMIEKWMSAYPTVEAWMEQHEATLDALIEEDEMDDMNLDQMMQAGFEAMKSHPIYNDFKKLIKPLGYDSDERFIHDTVTIFKTFTAISFKEEMAELGGFDLTAMQAQLQEIEQMQGLNESQKSMMKQQLESAMGQMAAVMKSLESVSEEDMQTLRPYFADIASLFDSESEE